VHRVIAIVLFAAVSAFLFTGCLGIEKKEYSFKLNPDGSGSGTIRYINIVSQDDKSDSEEGKDVSFKDFAELVSDYMDGTKFEDDHPYFKVTEKKLYEENGILIGEVKFTFSSLDSTGFYRKPKCDCCPVLYFNKSDGGEETIAETNGKLVENVASSAFIEWEGNTREFAFKTTLLSDLAGTRSMAGYYRTWKENKK
jgi:hypothetical protein